MSGYQALREGAAWLGLSRRGRIRATGEDRLRLLHAMSSNAVEDLKPGEGVRAYFLNAQGHILADTRIWVFEDSTLLDTEPETRQSLAEHLEQYIIMDDVTLEDVTDSMAAVAVEGPQARAIVATQIGAAPESGEHHLASSGVTVVATSATGQPGCWLLAEAGEESELIRRLEAAGVAPATPEDTQAVRVENGVVRHTQDFFETTLPQESGQMGPVSFAKGCYLGQEIVERVRARGKVRRQLVRLEIDTAILPSSGSAVLADGHEIGTLTSPVFSPRMGACLGFSIVRRDASGPDRSLTVGGHAARVTSAYDTV